MAALSVDEIIADKADDEFWGSFIWGHANYRHRYLTMFCEREFLIDKWLDFKTMVCDRWFLPFWTPLFFLMTHVAQRNRNLYLVENHLNYQPWKYRYNDKNKNKY